MSVYPRENGRIVPLEAPVSHRSGTSPGRMFVAVGLVSGLAFIAGCRVIPVEDLRAFAAQLPSSDPLSEDDREQLEEGIRLRTGVAGFRFGELEIARPQPVTPFLSSIYAAALKSQEAGDEANESR